MIYSLSILGLQLSRLVTCRVRMCVAQAGRMVKDPTEVRHAIIDVLAGLTHMRMPDPVDVRRWDQELFRRPSLLVILQELPIVLQTRSNLSFRQGSPTEKLVVFPECGSSTLCKSNLGKGTAVLVIQCSLLMSAEQKILPIYMVIYVIVMSTSHQFFFFAVTFK